MQARSSGRYEQNGKVKREKRKLIIKTSKLEWNGGDRAGLKRITSFCIMLYDTCTTLQLGANVVVDKVIVATVIYTVYRINKHCKML